MNDVVISSRYLHHMHQFLLNKWNNIGWIVGNFSDIGEVRKEYIDGRHTFVIREVMLENPIFQLGFKLVEPIQKKYSCFVTGKLATSAHVDDFQSKMEATIEEYGVIIILCPAVKLWYIDTKYEDIWDVLIVAQVTLNLIELNGKEVKASCLVVWIQC